MRVRVLLILAALLLCAAIGSWPTAKAHGHEDRPVVGVVIPDVSVVASPVWTVSSTAYVATGNRTASGEWPAVGMVAMNDVPFGTVVTLRTGPLAGQVFVVADRIGWGSDLDIFMDSYDQAIQYGRRQVEVEVR